MSDTKQTPAWFQYPEYHWKKKHAIVVGAGIAGCQMAWHLSQQGWQVTLIERHDSIATEASGNPAGVISPKITSKPSSGEDFYTESFHYTLSQLKQLQQQGLEWHSSGLLQLTHNSREIKRWVQLKDRGFDDSFLQLLDEAKTSETAGISLPYKASYFPQAGWINPAHFCQILINDSSCVKLLETDAIRLEKQQSLWQVFNKDDSCIAEAELVIIANGKDLTQFEQTQDLPCMPVAGQTTLADASKYSEQLKTVIGHEGYLTPVEINSNQHTFGATFDRNNDNPEITQKADTDNYQQLNKYLPDFADSLLDTKSAHAAVRLTTPDRFPYLGAIPDLDFYSENYDDLHHGKKWKDYPQAEYQNGLFVFGSFGSRGLTTSGYCAKILTDIIENRSLTNNEKRVMQDCHPARYLIKQLKKGTQN